MFIRAQFKPPANAKQHYEIRYAKGRKPFPTLNEAEAFIKAEESEGRWGEASLIVTIPVKRSKPL